MHGHLDAGLMADGHDRLEEVLEIRPEFFLGHILVLLEQLVQLCHALRLPAGEGHVVLLREAHDVVGHLLRVVLDHVLLIEQGRGAVAHRVEEVAAGPVEDGHEIVADDLHAEGGQVADGLDVVGDERVAGLETDLDVVVDVHALHHVGVEACGLDLRDDLFDLIRLPDLAGHFVVQRPDDGAHAGDLPDVAERDLVISFAVPAKTHLHRHLLFLLFVVVCYSKKIISSEARR